MRSNHWIVAVPDDGERILVGPFFSSGSAARFAEDRDGAEVLSVVATWDFERKEQG